MTKITMKQGTTRKVVLGFVQTDKVTPLDLTGAKVYFTVKNDTTAADGSNGLQKTVTSFTNPTSGSCTVTILPADTVNLTAGSYSWDAKAIASDGSEVASDTDQFLLQAAVTKAIT